MFLSIPVDHLRLLLNAIKRDHPDWDGSSQPLKVIFEKGRIDPKAVYATHYSTKKPWIVITYGWASSDLFRLASILEDTDVYGQPLHLGKTVWIDVLLTKQVSTEEETLNSQ